MQGTSGEGVALVLVLTQPQLQDMQRSAGLDKFVHNLVTSRLTEEWLNGSGRRRMLSDED